VRYDTAHIDTGWNYHTLYQLATSFIQQNGLMHEFESFLEEVDDEEREEEADDGV